MYRKFDEQQACFGEIREENVLLLQHITKKGFTTVSNKSTKTMANTAGKDWE